MTRLHCLLYGLLSAVGCLTHTFAQEQTAAATPVTTAPAAEVEMIQLAFPENVEVKLLADYVSKRLGMNFLYDQAIGQKRITIVSPTKIPKDSLVGLFESVLKMSGLAMVEAEQAGWKKIVAVQDLLAVTQEVTNDLAVADGAAATAVVTQIFALKSASSAGVDQAVRPFLSRPGGNSFQIPDRGLLMVTDYAGNVRRAAQIVAMLDQPRPEVAVHFLEVKNVDARELVRQVAELMGEKQRLRSGAPGRPADIGMAFSVEPRSNQIVMICPAGMEEEATALIRRLDVAVPTVTRSYRLSHISPQRIDQLARELMGAEAARSSYKALAVAESGLLVVTAPEPVHSQIDALAKELDVAQGSESSNIRFYKLMNTTALSVLGTIRMLSGQDISPQVAMEAPRRASSAVASAAIPGANNPPPPLGGELPKPPSYVPSDAQTIDQSADTIQPAALSGQTVVTAVQTRDALITEDPNTNTIIVVAPPAVQSMYKQLILLLDKRRPQVMVEVTLVTLDTTNSFSLGVDLSAPDSQGRRFLFSSFGLSQVDADTGQLALAPGTGFNGAILGSSDINIVLRALATSGRAKVLSAPKVLVNDNSSATLNAVNEAPFTSLNASDTVSTVSFAGYASAGTVISLTPRISEGDHLQLKYSITLSSFTGTSSGGIPPPRQTNSVDSEITVPDGCTIVVGGLTREDVNETVSKVPFLGDIPLLGYVFSNRTTNNTQSTLFVFVRPVILRDDQFEDLKYYSRRDQDKAGVAQMPGSSPKWMR